MEKRIIRRDMFLHCDTDKPYVFISYSSKDKEFVWNDAYALQQSGFNVWIDHELKPTDETWHKAMDAITSLNCDLFIFYLSSHSAVSQPCLLELKERISPKSKMHHNGKEIPLIIADTEKISNIASFRDHVFSRIKQDRSIPSVQKNAMAQTLYEVLHDHIPSDDKPRILFDAPDRFRMLCRCLSDNGSVLENNYIRFVHSLSRQMPRDRFEVWKDMCPHALRPLMSAYAILLDYYPEFPIELQKQNILENVGENWNGMTWIRAASQYEEQGALELSLALYLLEGICNDKTAYKNAAFIFHILGNELLSERCLKLMNGQERSIPSDTDHIENVSVLKNEANDGYYFNSQKYLVDALCKNAVDRSVKFQKKKMLLTDAIRYVIEQHESGYILINGSNGSGKSTAAAQLVKKYSAIHHFVINDEFCADEQHVIGSVIEQICRHMNISIPDLNGNLSDLAVLFYRILQQYSQYLSATSQKGIAVLAAIDKIMEKTNYKKLFFLPEYLPDNLYFLLFVEHADRINNIRILYRFTLDRFRLQDTMQLAISLGLNVSSSVLRNVCKSLQGDPSKIDYFLRNADFSSNIQAQLDQLKKTANLYDQVIQDLLKDESASQAVDMIELLAVAQDEVPFSAIKKMLAIKKRNFPHLLEMIEPYVTITETGMIINSLELKEYLLGDHLYSLDDDEREELHRMYIDYYSQAEHVSDLYAVKCIPYHLLAIEDVPSILRVILATPRREYQFFLNQIIRRPNALSNNSSISAIIDGLLHDKSGAGFSYVIGIIQYVALDSGDYYLGNNLLERLDPNDLSDIEYFYYSYYKAVVLRMTGHKDNIHEAYKLLTTIKDSVPENLQNVVLLQYSDCARELGLVLEADSGYRQICTERNIENHLEDYLNALLYINDRAYLNGVYRDVLRENQKAEQLCREKSCLIILLRYYKLDAQVYNDICFYEKTCHLITEAIDVCDQTNAEGVLAELYTLLSFAESPESGLNTAKEAIRLNEKYGSRLEYGKSVMALGHNYMRENKFEKAKKQFDQSLTVFSQLGYKSGYAKVCHEIAVYLYRTGEFQEAMQMIEESKKNFIRDYGTTHRAFMYRNRILELVIQEKSLTEDRFEDLLPLQLPEGYSLIDFIHRYFDEVVGTNGTL